MHWSSALLALLASSQCVRGTEKHKVVVVGAGISGFTAAATLIENNVTDVIILEASDRIGGRVHTVQYGGVTMDKGAEFVQVGDDCAVYQLVRPYDLLQSYNTFLEDDMYIFANTSGDVFNGTLVKKMVDAGYELLDNGVSGNVSGSSVDYLLPRLNNMLHENNVDPELSEGIRNLVIEMLCANNAPDELSQLGIKGTFQAVGDNGDFSLKWKTGGYKTIFDIVSKKYPNPSEELPVVNKTAFGKQVTRIERKEDVVELTCADGSSYVTSHVIVTPSLGVLKKHAAAIFHPPLPALKTEAIETMGFGCVGKVFLLFPTRWWPKDINAIIPLFSEQDLHDFQKNSLYGSWSSRTTGFYPVINHDRMLCVWFSGQSCRTMELLTEDEVTDGLMELLIKLVGKTYDIPKPESILRSNWASNPYTLGAYSYHSVTSDEKNFNSTHLAEPILDDNGKPVIMFAGEATHPHYDATVHGALATGRREAKNLLSYLAKQATV